MNKRLSSRAVILMYHSIAEVDVDPFAIRVRPDHFAEHLQVLRKYCRPLSLIQLVQELRDGELPDRAVALTFDDGYADNLCVAKPLLERHDIPATMFLATAYLGTTGEFWWDELERLLLEPIVLPRALDLDLAGHNHHWELEENTTTANSSVQNHDRRAWEGAPGSRMALYESLWQHLWPLPHDVRGEILSRISAWAVANPKRIARPTHRILSLDEAGMLKGDFIEVGAHSMTHPKLSAHSTTVQRDEILRSKARVEEISGAPANSFAYPFGNFTAETIPLVREAGFACACSTIDAVVWRKSDPFRLPRREVQDWNGEEFSERLQAWLND